MRSSSLLFLFYLCMRTFVSVCLFLSPNVSISVSLHLCFDCQVSQCITASLSFFFSLHFRHYLPASLYPVFLFASLYFLHFSFSSFHVSSLLSLSLLYVSRVSTRILTILAKILMGSARVTFTRLKNTVLYMGCRQSVFCLLHLLGGRTNFSRSYVAGNDFPEWR